MPSPARLARLILSLRRAGVIDGTVLAAMERVPREAFVAPQFLDQAYEDTALPIGAHQTLSAPSTVGLMTQALAVGPADKVLEVGTGSGYQAAVLSRLCRRVYTIERHRELAAEAGRRFATLRFDNIATRVGDGTLGWPVHAPFDRIVVTAAARDIPPVLVEQLAEGGIMVVPVDDGPGNQRLLRVRRFPDGVDAEDLGAMRFVPLIADEAPRRPPG